MSMTEPKKMLLTLCNSDLSEVVDVHHSDINIQRGVAGRPSWTHTSVVDHDVHRAVTVANLPHCLGNRWPIGEVKRYNSQIKCWRLLTSCTDNSVTKWAHNFGNITYHLWFNSQFLPIYIYICHKGSE